MSSIQKYSAIQDLVVPLAWNQRALNYLEVLGKELEKIYPKFGWQNTLDNFYTRTIEPIFNAPCIQKTNEWLKYDGSESVLIFAGKLTPRAFRNLLVLVCQIIKVAGRTFVHPLKTSVQFLQFLVVLAHALMLPETYTGLGAGFIGASVGQAVLAPGPQVVAGLIIGAVLMAFGLAFGAIKAAVNAEEGHRLDAIVHQLGHQIREMPEAAMTGFFVGLILGAVEQVIDPEHPAAQVANVLDDLGGLGASLENFADAPAY